MTNIKSVYKSILSRVSETKEQVDRGLLTNVNLNRYDFYSQTSKTSSGGVAIYIKSSLNYFIRDYLKQRMNSNASGLR